MRYQPNRDYASDDVVMTPRPLAHAIVDHFKPNGRILEPCAGDGAFLEAMPGAEWCEINQGRDFFEWTEDVDWIVTNPPWSQIRPFLHHSMEVANNVVFLCTTNHLWTKARQRLIRDSGFHITEIANVEPYPGAFPQSGFQLGVTHLKCGPSPGWTRMSTITWVDPTPRKRKRSKKETT